MRPRNRFWSIVTALAFVFAAMGMAFAPSAAMAANPAPYLGGNAIPPYPLNPDTVNYSAYLVSEDITTAPTRVKFVIEAGDANEDYEIVPGTAFRKELCVVLSGSTPRNVNSVLLALNGTNGLTFYGKNDAPFTADTNHLAAVEVYGAATWEEDQIGFDGWVFRVNDLFPTQPTEDGQGYEGTGILQTPVKDGDVVHWFFDFPSDLDDESGNIAANYVRAKFDSFDSGSNKLTVQLQGHKTHIQPTYPYQMDIFNYVDLTEDLTASIYTERGVYITNAVIDNVQDGKVSFTSSALAAGKTYIVKTAPTFYYTNEEPWDEYVNGVFFVLTGAYSKVSVPGS